MTARSCIALTALTLAVACNNSNGKIGVALHMTALEIDVPLQNPYAGASTQLIARAVMNDGTSFDVTQEAVWNNSAPAIVSLSEHGALKALKKGAAQISATYKEFEGRKDLDIGPAKVVSLGVTPPRATLALGDYVRLNATAVYTDGLKADVTETARWTSSTPTIASVSTNGTVQSIRRGIVTVSVQLEDATASSVVTVTDAVLRSLVANPASVSIPSGMTQPVRAIGTYSDQSVRDLTREATWSIDNTATATVLMGVIQGKAPGVTVAHARVGNLGVDVPVEITPAILTALIVTPSSLKLPLGTHATLTATGTFSDKTTRVVEVTWTSAAPSVAAVDATGYVTAAGLGTTWITVATGAFVVEVPVEVTAAVLQSLVVPATSTPKGRNVQLTATGTYSDGTVLDVTRSAVWSSQNGNVVQVSNAAGSEGFAYALAVGATTVTAQLDGITASAAFEVTPPVLVSLALSPAEATIPLGTSQQFVATGWYTDGTSRDETANATWSATPDGLVQQQGSTAKGVAMGDATVLAQVGSIAGSALLHVTQAELVSISVAPEQSKIAKGRRQSFAATGHYTDNTTQNLTTQVTWTALDADVASFSSQPGEEGVATGLQVGTAAIDAALGAVHGSAVLEVTPAELVAIVVSPDPVTLAKGLSQQFSALGTYTDATESDVTAQAQWSVGPEGVATVTATANATGIAVGSTHVIATIGTISDSAVLTVTPPELVSIAIAPAAVSIAKGLTATFSAIGTFTDGSTQPVSPAWSAIDPTVAAFTGNVATALDVGSTFVVAAIGAISATAPFQVTPAELVSLAVSPQSASIPKGRTQQFTATGTYTDNSQQVLTTAVSWTSGAVATIDVSGLATGVAIGTTAIVATLGSVTGSATLHVTAPELVSINVTPPFASIPQTHTQQYEAIGVYTDASEQVLTSIASWTTQPAAIASISNGGLATALVAGTTTVMAQYQGVTGSATLEVIPRVLVSIAVTPSFASIAKGRSQQFSATGSYSDGSQQPFTSEVTWASSAPQVATIDASGLAASVDLGTTTITATLGDIVGSATLDVAIPELVSMVVIPDHATIAKGRSIQLTAVGTYTDGSTQTVAAAWSSASLAVAVTQDGLAIGTAQTDGPVVVTATSAGVSATAAITVGPPELVSVEVTPGGVSIAKGTYQQYTLTALYSDGSSVDATGSAQWTSSSIDVASIDRAGLAHALSQGETIIRGAFGGMSDETTLTVSAAVLLSIEVSPTDSVIAMNTLWQFTAIGIYSDGTTQDLTLQATWSSDDTRVATIDGAGLATAVSAGSCVIMAVSGVVSGNTTLTVTNAVPVALEVNPVGAVIAPGTTQQYSADAIFSDGSFQDVTAQATWTSSTVNVATISATALATAVNPGSTVITATVAGLDCGGVPCSDSQVLTVTSAPITALEIVPAEASIPVGLTQQFVAIATLADGTTQDVTASVGWASSVTSVATISNTSPDQGLATGVKPGTTTITAMLNGYSALATLVVTDAKPVNIAIWWCIYPNQCFSPPTVGTVVTGYYLRYHATATYSDGSTYDVTRSATWASSDTGLATISNDPSRKGIATGRKATPDLQYVTISATLQGATGTASLRVVHFWLNWIEVLPNVASVPVRGTVQLDAYGHFFEMKAKPTGEEVILEITLKSRFYSSDKRLAAVRNGVGLVRGLAPGDVTITAARQNKRATASVTVTP